LTTDRDPPERPAGYATAQALLDAIASRVRNAVEAGSPYRPNELRRQLAYDRLLARVFTVAPDRWVLKGAGNLLARMPEAARFSLDVDLFYRGELDAAVQALLESAQLDLGDHFRFEVGRPRDALVGARGLTLPMGSRVGPRLFERFSVDLVVELTMTSVPEEIGPLHPIDIEGLPSVRYRGYPVADQIADKHCAIVERHGEYGDFPSTRYRDLVDLVLIAGTQEVNAGPLRAALDSEFERRGLARPARFEVPKDGNWQAGYPRAAKDAPGLTITELADAVDLASSFLDPVLAGQAAGRWDPPTRSWRTSA
jgi:hypothetical protein